MNGWMNMNERMEVVVVVAAVVAVVTQSVMRRATKEATYCSNLLTSTTSWLM